MAEQNNYDWCVKIPTREELTEIKNRIEGKYFKAKRSETYTHVISATVYEGHLEVFCNCFSMNRYIDINMKYVKVWHDEYEVEIGEDRFNMMVDSVFRSIKKSTKTA